MKTRVAINGFGRIGRITFRIAHERDDLDIVGINDLTDTKTLAYLLAHDSNYGNYQHKVEFDEKNLIIDGVAIPVLAEKDPNNLPWRDLNVDVVIESTGRFTTGEAARTHINAGAKRVVISAPSKSDDVKTIVIGANDEELKDAGEIISNASCTTNSAAAANQNSSRLLLIAGLHGIDHSCSKHREVILRIKPSVSFIDHFITATFKKLR